MILINLLPHREAARQRRKTAFFVFLGLSAAVGVLVAGLWVLVLDQAIAAQRARNDFLSAEIAKLEEQIKDVATLRAEIDALRARQKSVEDLQIDRNIPVHILNELVRHTPDGVYFSALRNEGNNLVLTGLAQSQERVSELLRSTGTQSEWFTKPDLIEIKASGAAAPGRVPKRLYDFQVRLSVKRPQDVAPAQAASAAERKAGKE